MNAAPCIECRATTVNNYFSKYSTSRIGKSLTLTISAICIMLRGISQKHLRKVDFHSMITYILPIALIVASNVFYNICAKSTPKGVNPFAMLTITYVTAAVCMVMMLLVCSSPKAFAAQFKGINWTSYALGIAIIGLELGYIQAYRVGWNISIGSLVANICLAALLIAIGVLFYKEHISLNGLIGIALCIIGLIFINKA